MTADAVAVSVAAIIFLGTLVRSALGFGEALVAVPLMALVIPVEEAAPVAVLVSIAVAAMILLQDWRKVHFRSAGRLLVSTLFGIPAGLALLRFAPQPVVKAVLAVVIIAFSLHALASSRQQSLSDDRWAWLFGFQAGILG
ncbi:MAG: sulfite exporter TauE/SafE family protein, partial [Acidobacteriota bacterium]